MPTVACSWLTAYDSEMELRRSLNRPQLNQRLRFMFSKFFGKSVMMHPTFGEISQKRNRWEGSNAHLFEAESVRISVPGNSDGPSQELTSEIEALNGAFSEMKEQLAKRLYDEHYSNGREAIEAGEFDDTECYPDISSAAELWNFAKVISVVAEPHSTADATQIQIGIAADWDEDHELGFVFEDGKVVEFNGSIPPF